VASKQRRPGQETESAAAVSGPVQHPAVAQEVVLAGGAVETARAGAAAWGATGQGLAERVALALCVAPRDAETTGRLAELVGRSALPDGRKGEILERLRADQSAADRVAAAVQRAFGRDDAGLRGALADGARRATDATLVEVVAAHTGHPESAVRTLCDDLAGWVGWWWDEEEDEDVLPGDYATEESGS
jgi:hypothetical protein